MAAHTSIRAPYAEDVGFHPSLAASCRILLNSFDNGVSGGTSGILSPMETVYFECAKIDAEITYGKKS